jgi:carbamate kinase
MENQGGAGMDQRNTTQTVVVALGGNALLERDEAPTAENQRRNAHTAAAALSMLSRDWRMAVTHGNGPQVGLLALQSPGDPLDILDAESEGQIGYLIEQELRAVLGPSRQCVTLLTQVEVDPGDPAFSNPTKPIGPLYDKERSEDLARSRDWTFVRIGDRYRRCVASPKPKRILAMDVIRMLVEEDVVTICAGGGGIPIVVLENGRLCGAEAVIDKDLSSARLAKELHAEVLLLLTDVDGVYTRWGEPDARLIRRIAPDALRRFSFAVGSMGPKVDAACEFVETTGGTAAIGTMADAPAILAGHAGTLITADAIVAEYQD